MKFRSSIHYPILVPFISEKVLIDKEGNLFTVDGKEITVQEFVKRTGIEVEDSRIISVVSFQKINLPPVYWKSVTVGEKIKDYQSVENFFLRIKAPIRSVEFPNFFIVIGFSNYLIDEKGTVIKKTTMEEVVPSLTTTGYYTLRLTDDSSHTSNILRHRFVAMAFHPLEVSFDSRVVNHINLERGDDRIENLEWCTSSENNRHASLANGAPPRNCPVEIRDVDTGNVILLDSHYSAADFLSVARTTIQRWVKEDGKVIHQGFQIRSKTDEKWPVPIQKRKGFLLKYPSGKLIECDGMRAAKLVGLTNLSFSRSLREGRNLINGIFITRSES